jgi:hypothetical protein
MSKEPHENVWRITAQYVADCRTGKHPAVGDLIARYPQHAHEIADFVAYYHMLEESAHQQDEGKSLSRVAESSPHYAAWRPFYEAAVLGEQPSPQQKAAWLDCIDHEELL